MRAVKLEIDGEQSDHRLEFEAPLRILSESKRSSEPPTNSRELSPKPTAARCPHCESIVYSRRTKLCGVCSQVLPHTLLFDAAEAEKIEQLLARERHRHRLWMERYSNAR